MSVRSKSLARGSGYYRSLHVLGGQQRGNLSAPPLHGWGEDCAPSCRPRAGQGAPHIWGCWAWILRLIPAGEGAALLMFPLAPAAPHYTGSLLNGGRLERHLRSWLPGRAAFHWASEPASPEAQAGVCGRWNFPRSWVWPGELTATREKRSRSLAALRATGRV